MSSEKKFPKPLKIILCVIAAIIVILAVIIAVFSSVNVKAMNSCIDSALDAIREEHTLTEIAEDEYDTIKLNSLMKFDVDHYRVENVGNLSVMRLNMGMMQMSTFVLTPDEKDIPVLSADYIYIFSSRKTYLEVYDLVVNDDDTYRSYIEEFTAVMDRYSDIQNAEHSDDWYTYLLTAASYKKCGIKDDTAISDMLSENVRLMLKMADEYPELTAEEAEKKREIILEYTDGLIEKGGVSTDVFKKSLGEEKTKDFFDKVFFGTSSEE